MIDHIDKEVIMKIEELIRYVRFKYPLLNENKNWGERGLFYNPHNQFPKGAYVLTFKEKDGGNDSSSNLNVGNKYRLNIKVSKNTFIKLFETVPHRPAAAQIIKGNYDFTECNKVMPHPIYGWMTWVCVINPTLATIEMMEIQGLFEEAYQSAVANINKKLKSQTS
jgi:hypothetical protein